MNNELTREDIKKMQEELDYRRLELMPGLIEEVKRTRAFGGLTLGMKLENWPPAGLEKR